MIAAPEVKNGTGSLPLTGEPFLPAYLSASSLKDYLGCSLRFFFGRVRKIPVPNSGNLLLGNAVHAAVQEFHLQRWREQEPNESTVLEHFDAAFAEIDRVDPVSWKENEAEEKREKGRRMVTTYIQSDHARDPQRPVAVEVALTESLHDFPVDMVGQVDLVRRGNGGGLIPCDFKTIANTPNLEQESFLHETQMVLYQLLVEAATGGRVESREIVFITKHKEPKVIVHSLPRADAQAVERFWAMASAVRKGIHEARWYPQPGMHCAWCSFREQCASWTGREVVHA